MISDVVQKFTGYKRAEKSDRYYMLENRMEKVMKNDTGVHGKRTTLQRKGHGGFIRTS